MWDVIVKFLYKSSFQVVLLVFGTIFVALSCFDKVPIKDYETSISCPWILCIIGTLLIIVSIILFVFEKWCPRKENNTTAFIFNEDFRLSFHNISISFRFEDIQKIDNSTATCGFVLPISTNPFDGCITSASTAAGSFIAYRHTARIDKVRKILQNIATIGKNRNEKIFDQGRVIVLSDEFNTPGKVMLVASSEHNNKQKTNPIILFKSLANILQAATDNEINHLYLPIIGSGHGGMSLTDALNLLIMHLKFLSQEYTERREITICIRAKEVSKINAALLKNYQ